MQGTYTPDAILIDRFSNGDKAAMDALVRRHLPRAFAYAMRLSHDHDVAADVVADTFIRVNRSAAGFKGHSAFSTWIHTLTKNCYLDIRRKALLRATETLDDPHYLDGSSVERQIASGEPGPYEFAEAGERAGVLTTAIENLPENQRVLVVLFHVKRLTYEEIAEDLRIPIGTIKSRLHRARITLQKALQPERYLLGLQVDLAA